MDGYATQYGMVPAELNGYSIIAAAYVRSGELLVMGEKYRNENGKPGELGPLVYVTSTMSEGADYWHNGTYFDGPDSDRNKHGARLNFAERLQDAWSL